MIYYLKHFFWRMGRFFSRSEWIVRLLRLPAAENGKDSAPGLVLVQIDGLAHLHLEKALRQKRMPFLRSLLEKEHYSKLAHYSGVPSNTPVVQGMLFYGVKTCVPAFSFFDKRTDKIVHLFESDCSSYVEESLQKKGPALLKGGSSYGNIFSGGAKSSHFCSTTLGWGDILKAANPITLFLTLLLNLHILIRAFFLGLVEIGLAVWDCLRGILLGKDLWNEISFIPLRVAVCILLREAVTTAAKIDLARGVKVVHVNLAGYDEEAHHRGPGSNFAYWTLQGVDAAIRDIFNSARRSVHRDYEVWVYSDHGQEETVPYVTLYKRSVHEAVKEVFEERILKDQWQMIAYEKERRYWRADLLSQKRSGVSAPPLIKDTSKEPDLRIVVAAMGPLGHIYSPIPLEREEREKMAEALVASAKIPLVMSKNEVGEIDAWTEEGKFVLPRDGPAILGLEHPTFKETAEELAELCKHEDAGSFVISGWRKNNKTVSFMIEQGAHAGPGPVETKGFALLPRGVLAGAKMKPYIRTEDLRLAAAHFLKREDIYVTGQVSDLVEKKMPRSIEDQTSRVIRLMTYNVHSCVGIDGRISTSRIAKVITQHRPDIVALQELDHTRKRTRGEHQAQSIAKELEMSFEFQAALSVKSEQYGDAILSRYPMRPIRLGHLPRFLGHKYLEPRGALWVEIDVEGKKVHVVNTHLSCWQREGVVQTAALLGPDWMGNPAREGPTILCGDFNALPSSPICRHILRVFRDAQLSLERANSFKALWTFYPLGRIDHIFITKDIKALAIEVPNTYLERISSDHLPLIAELQI